MSAAAFFRPEHTYAHGPWRFYCAALAAHPETGEQSAIGWLQISDGSWTTYAYSAAEWDADWTDVTPEGKCSPDRADATPGLTDRQQRLLSAIRTHGGEWTTHRALALFALTDPGVVQRATARRDLAALWQAGHLALADDPDNRHYVLRTRKDGA
ncbi:hypothetical protein RM863_12630 [Streptomyces sp. DSM 41014]|uniref:Uncharacterized protein n=1 Tax=Streptomyces hintoniae TaxID=3075521 RepID=A0ABU2UI75_9ACTN|nr:hypothetical protein [Streptomyces sp. DSM 41014]MDT0472969.1 hypothetical protein [Streptomyces sp. DSM 41014]